MFNVLDAAFSYMEEHWSSANFFRNFPQESSKVKEK